MRSCLLQDVCDELLKLSEVNFHVSQIKIEEAKSTREQTIVSSSPAKSQPVVVNENLLQQNSLQNLPLVPGKRNYCEAAQQRPSPYNTLILTDGIPKGIRMYEFNSLLRQRKAKMSSKQMLHYIDIHLEDKSIDTVLLHVGVNDLLNDNSKSSVDNLMSNIHEIVEKCKQVGVRNIFVSGLVYTTRVSLPILESVHSLISNYCRENPPFYIDNRNIRGFCLYKDVLHLLEVGKKILGNNFIVNLNNFFLDTHIHHPPISL